MSLEIEIVEKETKEEVEEKEEIKKISFLKRYFVKKIKWILLIILLILAILIGIKTVISFQNKTVKIGFEDIGEFATQSAYCKELSTIDSSRSLYGYSIPFTQSKYIYSYDVVIKAGFDFSEIEWEKNDNIIEVKLPEAKILSSEIELDSFKVYHESESIFNQINMTNTNDSMKRLKEKAEEDAIKNGLLENARTNAEVVLSGFFGKSYNLDKYEIIFKDK